MTLLLVFPSTGITPSTDLSAPSPTTSAVERVHSSSSNRHDDSATTAREERGNESGQERAVPKEKEKQQKQGGHKETKLGTTSKLQSSSSVLERSKREGTTSKVLPTLDPSGDDKAQQDYSSAISSSRVHAKSERRSRESSSTPRGRSDSKKLTADELTQMSR
ncbi:hypothetical protein PGTUg99_025861 [Puccinia graminis f. sp. tritici]|uniref:Uncharacterized protein n=1 Tax=Puccinia graminis f. sp. tritici TaxID=56615 RepID=A0A5B0S0B2_PUCGR|nr:hypothetical protein PGTUg99_025861 [Puccinia graminis f. sp. tritici]